MAQTWIIQNYRSDWTDQMVVIKNYITEDDGTTTVVIKGVELDNKTSLLLDNGYEVEVDVRVIDPFKITDKQRRKAVSYTHLTLPTT